MRMVQFCLLTGSLSLALLPMGPARESGWLATSHAAPVPVHEAGPTPLLSFAAALQLASAAPVLGAAEQALRSQRALNARISAMTSNPQLSTQGGYRFLSEPERGMELQVYLQQGFNLAGYAGARRRAARGEADAVAGEVRALRLERQLQAAQSWLTQWGALQALIEARREFELAAEFLHRVERAAQTAVLTKVDVAEAQTYQAETQLSVLSLEGEIFDLGVELARVTGQSGVAQAQGPLPDLPVPTDDEAARLGERAAALPEPAARRLRLLAEGARVAEQRALRGAQLQVGVAYLREAPAAMVALGTLGLSLPLFDRGERELAQLVGARERMVGDAQEASLRARGEVVQTLHEVVHSGEILAQLRDQLVPATQETVRLREAAMRAGETTVLELLIARRAAALVRGRLRRAESGHAMARARALLLTQALRAGLPAVMSVEDRR